jgi:nucleotide-binding universal stress UspA family protein
MARRYFSRLAETHFDESQKSAGRVRIIKLLFGGPRLENIYMRATASTRLAPAGAGACRPSVASSANLAAHLVRHGPTAEIEHLDTDHADVQPAILSIAADVGIDLIVMGAYDHSRL